MKGWQESNGLDSGAMRGCKEGLGNDIVVKDETLTATLKSFNSKVYRLSLRTASHAIYLYAVYATRSTALPLAIRDKGIEKASPVKYTAPYSCANDR